MRRTHIAHVFQSFRVGGSEVRTCQIINGLGAGYRHTIVGLDGDFAAASLLDDPGTVELVHAKGFATRSFLGNAIDSRRWLKRLRPDLLIAYGWGGFEWIVGNSVRKLCPDIFSMEGFIADEANGELHRRRAIRWTFARRCTAVHACSLNLQELAASSWRVPKDKVRYIPNGIDLDRFSPRADSSDGACLRLGIVASLSPVKNHRLLLDAFRGLADRSVELHIVGNGPEREALESRAAELGVSSRVKFLGHCADPAELLRTFDVFCLSSHSEQMPISVLEAMASALPIASTDVGDVREMVTSDNRKYVVRKDDVAAYASALEELLADAALRHRLGRENRRRCEDEFGFALMLRRHHELYDRCVEAS
jgi:L-malate glycosyltransferase